MMIDSATYCFEKGSQISQKINLTIGSPQQSEQTRNRVPVTIECTDNLNDHDDQKTISSYQRNCKILKLTPGPENARKIFFRKIYCMVFIVICVYTLLLYKYYNDYTKNQLGSMIFIVIGYGVGVIIILCCFCFGNVQSIAAVDVNNFCHVSACVSSGSFYEYNINYAIWKIWESYGCLNVFGFDCMSKKHPNESHTFRKYDCNYWCIKIFKPLLFILVLLIDIWFFAVMCGYIYNYPIIDFHDDDNECIFIVTVCGIIFDFLNFGLLYSFLHRLIIFLDIISAMYGIKNRFSDAINPNINVNVNKKEKPDERRFSLFEDDGFFAVIISEYTDGCKVFTVLFINVIMHIICIIMMLVQDVSLSSKSLHIGFVFICYKTAVYGSLSVFGIMSIYQELRIFALKISLTCRSPQNEQLMRNFPTHASICCINGDSYCGSLTFLHIVRFCITGFMLFIYISIYFDSIPSKQ